MMKRVLVFLLTLMLLAASLPAMAGTPTPIEKIPYDQLPENRAGIHHYLLLCMDQWNGGLRDNNDGIVLLTFDTEGKRIMLTSLLRDSLVERPDKVIGRINYIVKDWGPDALCKIVSTHLGIKVDKYIIFNFQQIANIVDYMGGVEIEITGNEAAYLKRYPLYSWQTSPAINGKGSYLFTGRAAVIYMRIRKGNNGDDFMRTARVRNVLSILADKCRTMTYDQAKALLDSVQENSTTTNMSLEDLTKALDQAYGLRTCVIEELRLPQEGAFKPIKYAGMSVQDINWAMCREAMKEYLHTDKLVIDPLGEEGYD